MDKLERKTEAQALRATTEIYDHEIFKNRETIEQMENSTLPERDIVIEDAKKRIAQFQEKMDDLRDQMERFRGHEDEYAD